MEKYVIYYRVSTKKQGESGLGLDAQRAYVNHFVNTDDIAKEFTEIASAKYMDCNNRPELCKAIDYCKENNCTLVVAKIDRLSRKTEHALFIYEDLDGKLFSCDIPNLDKFTLTLFMAIADRERELISIRTKQALAERKKQTGEWRKGKLTKQARAKAIKTIKAKAENNQNTKLAKGYAKALKSQGMTLQAIADTLNTDGHTTARGKAYQRTSVKRLLES